MKKHTVPINTKIIKTEVEEIVIRESPKKRLAAK